MTWGEFKRLAEKNGIKDDMTIWYIDVSCPHSLFPHNIAFCPQEKSNPEDIGLTIST